MDCINEAKKFIKRAQEASHREVVDQNLAMADWYLTEALKERTEERREGRQDPDEPTRPTRVA